MKRVVLFILILLIVSCSEKGNLDEKSQIDTIENQEVIYNNLIDNSSESVTQSNNLSFLALGDSYTIGQNVSEDQRWPNQIVNIALNRDVLFDQPIIIAKTGWRTEQLLDTLKKINFIKKFDYVSLMIGVNNQYSLKSIDTFRLDLIKLLDISIGYTKKRDNVALISIPDWGVTPFGERYDRNKIKEEIDQFNSVIIDVANTNDILYVDVTEISRRAFIEKDLIANDSLHPSGKMYKEWAEKIYDLWIK
ncbi:MAG: SGNH/GDSL hydrolase family protein [Bacteroidota bacterium]|nr:SGNH/GDSL hydrolase family protein [Bacteroidota bacterium]